MGSLANGHTMPAHGALFLENRIQSLSQRHLSINGFMATLIEVMILQKMKKNTNGLGIQLIEAEYHFLVPFLLIEAKYHFLVYTFFEYKSF